MVAAMRLGMEVTVCGTVAFLILDKTALFIDHNILVELNYFLGNNLHEIERRKLLQPNLHIHWQQPPWLCLDRHYHPGR